MDIGFLFAILKIQLLGHLRERGSGQRKGVCRATCERGVRPLRDPGLKDPWTGLRCLLYSLLSEDTGPSLPAPLVEESKPSILSPVSPWILLSPSCFHTHFVLPNPFPYRTWVCRLPAIHTEAVGGDLDRCLPKAHFGGESFQAQAPPTPAPFPFSARVTEVTEMGRGGVGGPLAHSIPR